MCLGESSRVEACSAGTCLTPGTIKSTYLDAVTFIVLCHKIQTLNPNVLSPFFNFPSSGLCMGRMATVGSLFRYLW